MTHSYLTSSEAHMHEEHHVKWDLYLRQQELYFNKRALRSRKQALYVRKRALYFRKRALYFHKRALYLPTWDLKPHRLLVWHVTPELSSLCCSEVQCECLCNMSRETYVLCVVVSCSALQSFEKCYTVLLSVAQSTTVCNIPRHFLCCTVSNMFHETYPPALTNHVMIFKGWPPRDAPSKLVQVWYKSFPPDQRGQVEMKKPTNWVIKPVPHDLVRRIRFWRIQISGTWFLIFVVNDN